MTMSDTVEHASRRFHEPSPYSKVEIQGLVKVSDGAIEQCLEPPVVMKHDAGKGSRPELLDVDWQLGTGEVLKFGADKYADNLWRKGMAWSRVYGALLRHLYAFWGGEMLDPETGKPHMYHATCCIMFLSVYAHGPKADDYEVFDDRP
jgi:hypothetical protein